jgi:hypothetical protein
MSSRSNARTVAPAFVAAALLTLVPALAAAPRRVIIPLACTRGPGRQDHDVTVTAPGSVIAGSRYRVRVDGIDSGPIAHVGLRYIHDMRSDWPIPAGATYVEGSAHIFDGTGSENVRAGAHVVHAPDGIHLVLPAHVDNGASYTPPSFEFELEAVAPEGASITERFGGYSVTASVVLMGDLRTSCEPSPRDFAVAVTRVASNP